MAGMTAADLGSLLSTTRLRRWIYDVEGGIQGIGPAELLEVAENIGVRVGLLLGEDDPSEPSEFQQGIAVLEHFLDRRAREAVLDTARVMATRHPNWQHRAAPALRAAERDADYDVTQEKMPATGGP